MAMYKKRIKKWGLDKNNKEHEMIAAMQLLKKREALGKETELHIRGRRVSIPDLEKYFRRKGISVGKVPDLCDESLSLEISCSTPTPWLSGDSSSSTTISPQPVNYAHESLHSSSNSDLFSSSSIPDAYSHLPMNPDILNPPPAPTLRTRLLPHQPQTEVLVQSLLVAVILSALVRGVHVGSRTTGGSLWLESERYPDINILSQTIDLIAWLQLSRGTILVAVIYLLRFNALATFDKSHNVWVQLAVAFKLSQTMNEDETYAHGVWWEVLSKLGCSPTQFTVMEAELLSNMDLSLIVRERDWQISIPIFIHKSNSLLHGYEASKSAREVESKSTNSRWIQHKQEICNLYQSHTLQEVAKLMEINYGFSAR